MRLRSRLREPRRGRSIDKTLVDFKGTLLTDGAAAYGVLPPIAAMKSCMRGCWAHTRRQFERALSDRPQSAAQALDLIAALLCR